MGWGFSIGGIDRLETFIKSSGKQDRASARYPRPGAALVAFVNKGRVYVLIGGSAKPVQNHALGKPEKVLGELVLKPLALSAWLFTTSDSYPPRREEIQCVY